MCVTKLKFRSIYGRFDLQFYLLTMSDMDIDGVVADVGAQRAISSRPEIEKSQGRWLRRAGSV